VFRKKKTSQGRKRGESQLFDPQEYDRVVSEYTAVLNSVESNVSDGVLPDIPDPENSLGMTRLILIVQPLSRTTTSIVSTMRIVIAEKTSMPQRAKTR
jgi:hypothetical protein